MIIELIEQKIHFTNGNYYFLPGGDGASSDEEGRFGIDAPHLVNRLIDRLDSEVPVQSPGAMAGSPYYDPVDPKNVEVNDIAVWDKNIELVGLIESFSYHSDDTFYGTFFSSFPDIGPGSMSFGTGDGGNQPAPDFFLRPRSMFRRPQKGTSSSGGLNKKNNDKEYQIIDIAQVEKNDPNNLLRILEHYSEKSRLVLAGILLTGGRGVLAYDFAKKGGRQWRSHDGLFDYQWTDKDLTVKLNQGLGQVSQGFSFVLKNFDWKKQMLAGLTLQPLLEPDNTVERMLRIAGFASKTKLHQHFPMAQKAKQVYQPPNLSISRTGQQAIIAVMGAVAGAVTLKVALTGQKAEAKRKLQLWLLDSTDKISPYSQSFAIGQSGGFLHQFIDGMYELVLKKDQEEVLLNLVNTRSITETENNRVKLVAYYLSNIHENTKEISAVIEIKLEEFSARNAPPRPSIRNDDRAPSPSA